VGHTPRPRSCHLCAKTKTRCDKKWPNCSRCIAKGTECQYISKLPKSRTPGFHNNSHAVHHEQLVVGNQQVPAFEAEYFNLDVPDIELPETESSDFLNFETSDTDIYTSTGAGLVYRSSSPFNQQFQTQLPIVANWSIPVVPTSRPHSITKRPKDKVGTERTATLVLHTLKSYVLTMLRHNSLPPFIHSSLVSAEFLMEPLINCINLVHMISGDMKGSRKLFWRNVRMECERLCDEVRGKGNCSKIYC
jgi:hypothetical protein